MSGQTFPSGPWVGFYNYSDDRRKHRMDLMLDFGNRTITGDGNDDVGAFVIRGFFDTNSRECYWTKSYVGAHDVFYRGFREGKGIWGTWEISDEYHGGFHIWPRSQGEGEEETESNEATQPLVIAAPPVSTTSLSYSARP
jgi:hypothetical protein